MFYMVIVSNIHRNFNILLLENEVHVDNAMQSEHACLVIGAICYVTWNVFYLIGHVYH